MAARVGNLQELYQSWRDYVESGRIDPLARTVIREAWNRSEAYGLRPSELRPQQADPDRLRLLRRANADLIEAAEPYLAAVHESMAGAPHMLALADRDGNILRLMTDPATAQLGERANMFEGACWHEREIGCNGVGTALATGEPVILMGPEHYIQHYASSTCIGMPVSGPFGETLGALAFAVPNEAVSPHSWGWMVSVTQAVESALSGARRMAPRDVPRALHVRFQAVRGVLEFLGRDELLSASHEGFIREAQAEIAEAERELTAAWGERDMLLGSIAHELRSPLTVAAGHVMRLQRRVPADGELAETVEELSESVRRLREAIESILLLAETDRAEVDLELVAVAPAAHEAIAEAQPDARERIAVDVPPEVAVLGSRQWVRQVLANLLENATKYSGDGSEVLVTAETLEDRVTVRVLDRGRGIPPAVVERIFLPFVRGPEAASMGRGNGIGLALCKRLVELQGGTIWYAPREGGGSEFCFELPAAQPGSTDEQREMIHGGPTIA